MTGKVDRAAVRQFYHPDESWLTYVRGMALVYALLTIGAFAVGNVIAWLLLFGAAASYIVYDCVRERLRHQFGALAVRTRQIQASDGIDALLRVFNRTHLQVDELRTLRDVYQFEKERDLFREEHPEERLQTIFNKSVRMWSRGTRSPVQVRAVNWSDGHTEVFYNPVRVVALFLSTDAVVICDTEVDSARFGLHESISRIMVEDIVTIGFQAKDENFSLTDSQIMALAHQYNFSGSELRQLREELEHRATREPNFLQREVSSTLTISLKDGSAREFPIYSSLCLYRPGEVPERSSNFERTQDDLTVDRMVNELNRVVSSAKQRHAR